MRPRIVLVLWLFYDVVFFLISYALAYFWRVGWILSSDLPFGPYMAVAALVSPAWLLLLVSTGAFRLMRPQGTLRQFLNLTYVNAVGAALVVLGFFFLYDEFFSRLLLVEAFLVSTLILRVWHLLYERIARSILRRDPPSFPTLIVGDTRESRRLIELLQKRRNPLKPVAVLDGRGSPEKEISGVPVLGKLDRLDSTLNGLKITHLIQCSDLEQSLNLLSACRQHQITYLLLPSVLGVIERDERVESLEGWAVTMVRPDRGVGKGLFLP